MIKIYHHIYPTQYGLDIAEEQKNRIYKNISDEFEYIPNVVKKYQSEIWTLNKLQNDCKEMNDNTPILYIHTKGATKPTIERKEWREYMEKEVIDNYKFHIDILSKGFSASGVLMGIPYWSVTPSGDNFYGGNFWWTNSGYIKTLPKDLEWDNWCSDKIISKTIPESDNWIRYAEIKFLNQSKNFNPYTIPFFKLDGYEKLANLIVKEINNNKSQYNIKNIKNLL